VKRYQFVIETAEVPVWDRFRSTYRRKGLGKNLGEALMTLVKRTNREN